jgi:guanine deaminase
MNLENSGKRALLGSFVHSVSFGELELIQNGLMIYSIQGVIEQLLDLDRTPVDTATLAQIDVTDYTGKLIVPGFVDAHVHAPQYVFSGTGMDLPLTFL